MENQNYSQIKDKPIQVTNNQTQFDESQITKQKQSNKQNQTNKQQSNYENQNKVIQTKIQNQSCIENDVSQYKQNEQVSQIDYSQLNQSQINKFQNNSISQNNYHQFQDQSALNHQEQKIESHEANNLKNQKTQQNDHEQNMTQVFDQFEDHHNQQQKHQQQQHQNINSSHKQHVQKLSNEQNVQQQKDKQTKQIQQNKQNLNKQQQKRNIAQQTKKHQQKQKDQQKSIIKEVKNFHAFATYQNQLFNQNNHKQSQRQQNQLQNQMRKKQSIKQQQINQEQKLQVIEKKKKSKKKKNGQNSQPLPIISQQPIKNQDIKKQQNIIPVSSNSNNNNNNDNKNQEKHIVIENNKKLEPNFKIQQEPMNKSEGLVQVSQIIEPNSVAANVIIFQAQKQRIATVLQYFNQFVKKHQKHTKSQKQIIKNIYDQIQKKRQAKQSICNVLKDYFVGYASICKQFYEKSYKFTKSDKIFSLNPLINMKQQLKTGLDQLIFLRKSTGNQFNRLSDFITNNIQKSLLKAFMEYWGAVINAQTKHKQKRDQFIKKQKQFIKRLNKIQKVYTKGKMGISQNEDLFIEMTKFINQQKQYKKYLIEYGLSLIPLKKAFIKAQQTLYEQLQIIFNTFKNQSRNLYSIHKNEFTLIQKFEKQIKEKNTFEKLSDLMDSDYVRSVLLSHEKKQFTNITDKQYEKVFNMVHFETVVGNACDLLKGTTSKSFDLKTNYEQVVDTISGNLLIFNKQTSQMKQKFVMANINAKIVADGVIQIQQVVKGIIFDSNRNSRITFRDNDRAEQLICFLNQIQQSQAQGLKNKK